MPVLFPILGQFPMTGVTREESTGTPKCGSGQSPSTVIQEQSGTKVDALLRNDNPAKWIAVDRAEPDLMAVRDLCSRSWYRPSRPKAGEHQHPGGPVELSCTLSRPATLG